MSLPLLSEDAVEHAHTSIQAMRAEIAKALVGQAQAIEDVTTALLCHGHVLLEGVPGLGKTLLVKALGKAVAGQFRRVQFTPDLMPSDVIGHTFFDATTSRFVTRHGPVFTNLLLADEINRAPAKTQSALLEAMQERQVTLEGVATSLPHPFMVLATQNPIEQEGTYPLPEAQLDRFLFKIRIDYPTAEEEAALTQSVLDGKSGADLDVDRVATVMQPDTLVALQQSTARVTTDARVVAYAVAIARATREAPLIAMGAGPRGSIALVRAARARALGEGRSYATPDDVKAVALPALRHRVAPSADADIEGLTTDTLLSSILDRVPAPRA
jgi:MoxR-like ATPase